MSKVTVKFVCGIVKVRRSKITKNINQKNSKIQGLMLMQVVLLITLRINTYQSKLIFWLYLGLWSLYGVFYHTNEATKMLGYNILDLIAKAFVGIFFWLYLTKSVLF